MRIRILLFLVVLAAAVIPFLGVIDHGFLNWDDPEYVSDNPLLREAGGLNRIWSGFEDPQVYPVTMTSFWLEHRIWGDRPAGYHAINLLLHGLTVILLFRLLLRLGFGTPVALAASCLFALHPTQAASIAWIAERKNVLSGVFYFAALTEYVAVLQGKGWKRLGLAWCLTILALLSKTTAVTIPLTLVLLELWFRARRAEGIPDPARTAGIPPCHEPGTPTGGPGRPILRLAPFFGLAVLMGGLTVFREHGPKVVSDAGLMDRVLIAGRAFWFYVGKLLVPSGLSGVYARWSIEGSRLPGAIAWAGIAILAGLLIAGARRLPRAVPFGVAQFAIALLPTSGIIPFGYMDKSFVADHFLYLPAWGFWVAFFSLAALVPNRIPFLSRSRWTRSFPVTAAAVLAAAFLPVTIAYARTWRDTETFWNHVLSKDPGSWVALGNRGQWYAVAGRYEEALSDLKQAVTLRPSYVEAQFNLGYVLDRMNRRDEARAAYEATVRLSPQDPDAHNNLGVLLLRCGDLSGARREFEAVAALTPNDPSLARNFRILSVAEREAAARQTAAPADSSQRRQY
jgi:hypothetical protein